jgi:hypothetical protein
MPRRAGVGCTLWTSRAGAVDAALADPRSSWSRSAAVDAADIVRRSTCGIVLDVDITTTRAWTLRRETLSALPDDFLATIRDAVGRQRPTVVPG